MGRSARHTEPSIPDLEGGSDERTAELEAILEEIVRRRSSGARVDDWVAEEKYAHLMPELGERLRTLNAIEAAAREARATASSTADEDPILAEALAFLGEALEDYDLIERLHYGGQGVVYKAVQRSTRRLVAIKVLLHGPLATGRQRHRFAREVELISRLRHPNIVTLYESGVVRGRHYFAMEFVDGLPLDDYLLLHRPPARQRVELLAEVCRALSYAHQRGIIHRDLKPANILVDLDGRSHVLDFGLAKDLIQPRDPSGAPSLSTTGQVVGTLPYLSPEQAYGQDDEIDVRSDIYSLGVVLYEALTGCFPYPVHGSPEAVRAGILMREPEGLRKTLRSANSDIGVRCNEIDDDLEAIVRKTIEKDKSARYQSAAALTDDLGRYLAGEAVQAKADRHWYLLRKTLRKYRAHVAVSASFLLLLAASTVVVTAMWAQATTQRDNARQATRIAHSTLSNVLGEIEESVRPLVGGLAVRNRLLDHADSSLVRLRPLVESDDELSDVFAALHEKRGDIAYALGRHSDAAEQYSEFLDMSLRRADESEPNTLARQPVARAHRKLASVVSSDERGRQKEAELHFEAALRLYEELQDRYPDNEEIRYELYKMRTDFAYHLIRAGQYERAAQSLGDTIPTAERFVDPNSNAPRWTRLLAAAYARDGEIRAKLGDATRAVELLTRAIALMERLAEQEPTNADQRYELLLAYGRLGQLYVESGQPEKAEGLLRKGVAAGEYLTSLDPTVADWKHALYTMHYIFAHLLLELDELDDADAHCAASVRLAESLQQAEQDNLEWRGLVAFSRKLCGRVRLARNRPEMARADLESAVLEFEDLASAAPENYAYRANLAYAHDWLGACYGELDRPDAALEQYEAAYEVRRALAAEQPNVAERKIDLLLSKTKVADWYRDRETVEGDKTAAQLYSEAENALVDLRDTGQIAGQEGKFDGWLREIRENLQEVSTRAKRATAASVRPPPFSRQQQ